MCETFLFIITLRFDIFDLNTNRCFLFIFRQDKFCFITSVFYLIKYYRFCYML